MTPFADRLSAGRELAQRLLAERPAGPVTVLALPRGGVPVAAEIARALCAPLDLLLVRKIGAPWQPELAVAAVVDGDPPDTVIDEETAALTGVDEAYVAEHAQHELEEIARRRRVYLHGRAPLPLQGRTAIVVDDGIATGTTMRAALRALKRRGPSRTVLAVPVASPEALELLRGEVDEVVCLNVPPRLHAIGVHYADFHQVDDAEVLAAIEAAAAPSTRAGPP